MKKILGFFVSFLLLSQLVFGQLQTTNSSLVIGWDYPTLNLDTNMVFNIISLNDNNRTVLKRFNFDGDLSTDVTNNSKFVKSRVFIEPGTNNIIVVAELNLVNSEDSNILRLPEIAKLTVIRIKEIK